MDNRTVEVRFWTKVDQSGGPAACWPWIASRNQQGYGWFNFRGRVQRANRVVWMLTQGPIPTGDHVLHRCDNPPCVNPAHLFLGTALVNHRDAEQKRRHPHGATHGMAKLTTAQVIEIRTSGRSRNELARAFGVRPEAITAARHGRSWKDVA